jgi:hypothetical protein
LAEAITTHGSPRVGSGRDLHSHPNRSRIRLCESHRPGQSDLAETWVRSRCLQPKTIKTRPITTNEQTIKTPSHNSLLAMALLRARNLTLCLLIGRQKKEILNLLRFQGKRFVRFSVGGASIPRLRTTPRSRSKYLPQPKLEPAKARQWFAP